jgi:peptidoglycan/xylan/chitin deacetylase (PgdA/CDA1 family)
VSECAFVPFLQYMYSIGYVWVQQFQRPVTLYEAVRAAERMRAPGPNGGGAMHGWFAYRGERGPDGLQDVSAQEAYLPAPAGPAASLLAPPSQLKHGRGPNPGGEWPANWVLDSPHVVTRCTVPGTVALTFDDGPYIFTNKLLDTLAAYGAKATLFVNGLKYSCIYEWAAVLQRAVAEGHQIASHTWSHAPLVAASPEMVEQQMTTLETALMRVIGRSPAFMRPPYGGHLPETVDTLARLGYKVVLWDVDTMDWARNATFSQRAYEDSSPAHDEPHIVLNHGVHDSTVNELVPFALEWARRRGYRVVTVGECLGLPERAWYKEVTEPTPPDSSWYCV